MRRYYLLFLVLLTFSTYAQTTVLDGKWNFSIDPMQVGDKLGWTTIKSQFDKWEEVEVPHCFSDEPRYMFYTGHCWYGKKIKIQPKSTTNKLFLRFEAVFYKCNVYLNGKHVGAHEGGYTPFELDITSQVKAGADNSLIVKVDNSYDTLSVPGAKKMPALGSGLPYNAPFPWINYGGIIRSVKLIERPSVYIKNVKIEAEPDLAKGNASLKIKTFIINTTQENLKPDVSANVFLNGAQIPLKFSIEKSEVSANGETAVMLTANMPKQKVKLWNIDNPVLYQLKLAMGDDTLSKNFGFRKIEIKGNKFLLNGNELSLGGANRVSDYPGEGSKDPTYLLDKDLKLMKESGMVLQRIAHYAVNEYLLDWADKYGMLIINEAGNWGMEEALMANEIIRTKYRQQAREMIERDWNHPSVIGWSVGNEYKADLPEGIRWTKDMYEFTKKLDGTRPITFASNTIFRAKNPTEESSKYVDFVSANLYGSDSIKLEKIIKAFPDKPLFISEFGLRVDKYETEDQRIEDMKKVLAIYRKYPIIGASLWAFNDYRSQYANTAKDGYRPWGVVTADRSKRKMYDFLKNEFAPATCEINSVNDKVLLKITARNTFPKKIMEGYKIKYGSNIYELKKLNPGETETLEIKVNEGNETNVYLIDPLGFEVAHWKK